jgi:GAF domain-containing protein
VDDDTMDAQSDRAQTQGSAAAGRAPQPPGDPDDELATRLSELARSLQHQDNSHDTLVNIVRAAVELIPGVEEGSISVVFGRRHVHSEAATGELPRAVDKAQYETGEGPCLDAAFEEHTVRVPDMSAETRWPEFARRAVEAGACSMLAFQLYVDGDNLGALNVYARRPNAFEDESVHIGLLFAAHAAVAFATAQRREQLVQAVATRDLIGQAKGILMERFKITSDQAFHLLVQASQHTNQKLRDVADRLVASGELAARQD